MKIRKYDGRRGGRSKLSWGPVVIKVHFRKKVLLGTGPEIQGAPLQNYHFYIFLRKEKETIFSKKVKAQSTPGVM